MKIHQVKTKFKTEWEGWYPVKRILSDPFSLFRSSLQLVLVFFDAVDKLSGFSPNLQVFFTLISRFLGLLG